MWVFDDYGERTNADRREVRPTGAEEYLLDDLGLEPTHVDLDKEKRVMAAQLGENAFLVELEEFLLSNEELIRDLLDEEGKP